MKILHYSLGFPPYRTGGMTKYCMNLMYEQVKAGNLVSLLWPGIIKDYTSKINVKKRKKYELGENYYCDNFELINPLPVSLLDGIKDIDSFTREKDINKLTNFLETEKFDVIHIHTLMGLPREFIIAAKRLNIKVFFTTHDYFGLCPKSSLLQGNKICENDNLCNDCTKCNKTAMSLKKIKLIQSPFYKFIKNTSIIKKIRKNHIKNINEIYNNFNNDTDNLKTQKIEENKYSKLRKYYIDMLEMMTCILYNSNNTKKIYSRYFEKATLGKVVTISNSTIRDNRRIYKVHDKIHIGYLGPVASVRKGFYFLLGVLDKLYDENFEFELHIYQQIDTDKKYIKCHNPYTANELPEVMNNIDLLIVPSLWYETFGFTVLEALSFGIPVMVSENVGAKDLINSENGCIFAINENDLKTKLEKYLNNKNILEELNKNICKNQQITTMSEHTEEILKIYKNS